MSADSSTAQNDMLALAGVVARNAQALLTDIERWDLLMAHGYAILMTTQLQELIEALDEQVHQLPPPTDLAPTINPYTDPLDGRIGDLDALRKALTVEQLREHARFWNWSSAHQKDGHGRWWCSKIISATQRELADRGEDPESWQTGEALP